MRKNIRFVLLFCLILATACSESPQVSTGVSASLAGKRKENIRDLRYDLYFDVPEQKEDPLNGEVTIRFVQQNKESVILDFKGDEKSLLQFVVNGKSCNVEVRDEHIIIPAKCLAEGENTVIIYFTAPNTSLNRRDDFLYTLLVPDRARTLFPCFDQPDLKAVFSLKLAVPLAWQAVTNGALNEVDTLSAEQKKIMSFNATKPISTYLFSFVAGVFEQATHTENGRSITLYHRQTDPQKIAQIPAIFSDVFRSMQVMEKYTSVPYPFEKYDFVVLPGFQYGGMEHMGATLYNDSRIFLPEEASLSQRLGRTSLIAHETAHMWFGDYVTMAWFNDVWLKEVLANHFASKITAQIHASARKDDLAFTDYYLSAYSEDRTAGSTPVIQPLENLEDAGLVYGNIVYTKTPLILRMIVDKMGEAAFRKGIIDYLNKYAYSNATWDDLVACLDRYSSFNLRQWSDVWVKQKGMPVIESEVVNDTLFVVQSDPFGQGNVWPQNLSYLVIGDRFSSKISFSLDRPTVSIPLPKGVRNFIPNENLKGYGFFVLDSVNARYALDKTYKYSSDIIRRTMMLNLYENMLNSYISPEEFAASMLLSVENEKNPLLFSQAVDYLQYSYRYGNLSDTLKTAAENALWKKVSLLGQGNESHRKAAFQALINIGNSPQSIEKLSAAFDRKEYSGYTLSEDELINLSYRLAITLPEQSKNILSKQRIRILNADKFKEYQFVSKAVDCDTIARNRFFASLLDAENREIEPWVIKALALLNHPLRQQQALPYIDLGLALLPEIQKTGDIFFPQNWVNALLGGHSSEQAKAIVEKFITDNEKTMNPMLLNKLKQRSDHLTRW